MGEKRNKRLVDTILYAKYNCLDKGTHTSEGIAYNKFRFSMEDYGERWVALRDRYENEE